MKKTVVEGVARSSPYGEVLVKLFLKLFVNKSRYLLAHKY